MYFYKAYGLTIHSVLPFPELVATAETEADVVIQFGRVDRSLMESYRGFMHMHIGPEGVSCAWDKVGAVLVRSGKEIIIDPLPDVEERLLRLPILGMVFAILLHQRGFLTLHASAVEIAGGAAVFMARKGWGKSTLAATLYSRGHHLISDDLVAITISDQAVPMIIPAFPQLKLLPDAASALGEDPETLPRLASGYEKRSRRNIQRFSQHPLPIKGIFKLADGPTLALKPLTPQASLAELVSNSYIALCAYPLLAGNGGILHFHQCSNLIKNVLTYHLERPRSLELVPRLAQLVEENLSANAPSIAV